MHRAWTGVFVTVAVVLSTGCVSEQPVRTATPISSVPTLARPPLTTPSISPSLPPPFSSPVPSITATVTGQSYTVQAGDTLSSIAARFYGDASEWRSIFERNRDRMSGPEALSTGMVLIIPPRLPTQTTQAQTTQAPTTQGTPQR
jgi:nucleoid-associated protein YgaU